MRRYLAATFIGATLFLTGCSDTVGGQASQAQSSVSATVESTTPAPTTTQAPAPTTTTQAPQVGVGTAQQQVAISNLRSLSPYFASIPDATLVELFESACSALDRGDSIQFLVDQGAASGVPPYEVGAIIGASVSSTCTEYLYLVEEYIG